MSAVKSKPKKKRPSAEDRLQAVIAQTQADYFRVNNPNLGFPDARAADRFAHYSTAVRNFVKHMVDMGLAWDIRDWDWDGYDQKFSFWAQSRIDFTPAYQADAPLPMFARVRGYVNPARSLLDEVKRLQTERNFYLEKLALMSKREG